MLVAAGVTEEALASVTQEAAAVLPLAEGAGSKLCIHVFEPRRGGCAANEAAFAAGCELNGLSGVVVREMLGFAEAAAVGGCWANAALGDSSR